MTVILQQSDTHGKIWRIIRGLNEFNFDDVAMLTELSYSTTSNYLRALYQAGYIRQAGKRTEASGRKKVVWRLVRNTGPKAPLPCRCLYDPNIDEVAKSEELRAKSKTEKPEGGHVD